MTVLYWYNNQPGLGAPLLKCNSIAPNLGFTSNVRYAITWWLSYIEEWSFHELNLLHAEYMFKKMCVYIYIYAMSIIRKMITCLKCKLLLSFTAISDVYRSFISNKATFTTVLLSDFQSSRGSFEIHWVRQYLVNFKDLVGIVNTLITRLNQFSQV